jgi:prepilin-type N-terminal cleavage/methylation domain-containing protein
MKKTLKNKSFTTLLTNSKGFTVIEILIVLAVLSILFSLLLSVFFNLADYRALERDCAEIRAYLEEARIYTQSSRLESSYGVYFNTNGIELFRGDSWSTKEESLKTHQFNSFVSVSDSSLGGADEVVFHRLFGEPSVHGEIRVSGPKREMIINLFSSGIVE